MLRVNADHYVQVGKLFQASTKLFDGGLLSGVTQLTPPKARELADILTAMKSHCDQLQMPVTSKLLLQFVQEYERKMPTWTSTVGFLDCVERSFRAELEARLFVFIEPDRAAYFSDALAVGGEIMDLESSLSLHRSPSAGFDLREAGNCFASGCYTACVHHLSKIVEFGLFAFATFGGASDPLNWNKALNEVQKALSQKTGNFAGTSRADDQYYSEALGLLRNFKTAWRNPVSHVPVSFDETRARTMFSIVRATMHHLAERFIEIPMPRAVVSS